MIWFDSHSILAKWSKHICELLNVHWVDDVRQTDTHTAVPLMPKSSAFEVEMTNEKLKRHKSQGADQT